MVSGPTGSGKSTQIPQYILETMAAGSVVVAQPRRVAASSVAYRVAQELGQAMGQSVGYRVRLQKVHATQSPSIEFCTTGVLTRQMMEDPDLHNVSCLIVDEVHERTIECDLLISFLTTLLPRRPDLRLVLMSATTQVHLLVNHFAK